uniref:G-protein coupled receptors family 1 profile domain-containing protein n=1 Tax=Acrobeloides nanus TaxID=290746 RepID=A0A914CX07_9BILA
MTLLLAILVSIAIYSSSVVSTGDGSDCVQSSTPTTLILISKWIIAISFIMQLGVVSSSYSEIVRHVRKKFLQRKARVCANARVRQPLIAEPRYMREMTAAIIRIAFFHVVCWLPFCVIRMFPDTTDGLSTIVTTNLRIVSPWNSTEITTWVAFVVDWLTYCNSAGDWIFYAAMNRDLRSIIKATTERRKRSTLSQQSPPSNIRRSIRRQMVQSLRFFYSINSYRSNEDSVESVSTPNHAITTSTESKNAKTNGANENGNPRGRAHTYAAPRSPRAKDYTNPLPISAARYAAIKSSKGTLRSSNGSLLSVEKFV